MYMYTTAKKEKRVFSRIYSVYTELA